jgi:DNA-binding MarR family transcriptional regulator
VVPKSTPEGGSVDQSSARVRLDLIARAGEAVAHRVEDALRGAHMSVEQWRVMAHLYEHGGCTMSELSLAAGLTGATLTRMVDRLTTSALAHRNPDPTDRRRVLVHLSRRGRSQVRQLWPKVQRAEEAAGLAGAEAAELNRLLERMLGAH